MSKVTDEEGHTTSEVIRVGKGGDYASLDALVMDATNNLIEPWYQEDPDLVVIWRTSATGGQVFSHRQQGAGQQRNAGR
ncbi:P2 family phage major capsid protein [Escherichia coli]